MIKITPPNCTSAALFLIGCFGCCPAFDCYSDSASGSDLRSDSCFGSCSDYS